LPDPTDPFFLPFDLMHEPVPDPDETLSFLVQALTASGQAIAVFDAEDHLRYAN
jgi:diguanylate cyclase (GGDEF)-like protein